MNRGRTAQRAQTLVIFAVVLALFLVAMVGLVGDLGTLFATYNRVDSASLLAVQAGATAIDTNSVYNNILRLDPGTARQRCEESLAASRVSGDCGGTTAQLVIADARATVNLPISIFGLTAPVHVVRTGRPAYGGSSSTVTT